MLLLKAHPDGVARTYLQVFEQLRIPVAVAFGSRSTFYTESARAKVRTALPIPRVLDGGHNLHWDAPGALADAIAETVAAQSQDNA